MIVDPDFLDHWRTGMVIDALGDPMAPMYILRLWAHCQERKSDTFTIPTRGLKAQCKAPGDADAFEAALIEAGFIERNGDSITVVGWADKNASLLAAWANGAKGGRPKKEQNQNPAETHGKPSGNPSLTQAKPIREEKRREESNTPQTPHGGSPVGFDEFWTLYPRHTAKQNAVKAWIKVPASLHPAIFAAVKAQAVSPSWTKDGGQFIPHAASWINGKRWEDEAGAVTTSAKRNTPEYAKAHAGAAWWSEAGFDDVWNAMSAGCYHDTAHRYASGRRMEAPA